MSAPKETTTTTRSGDGGEKIFFYKKKTNHNKYRKIFTPRCYRYTKQFDDETTKKTIDTFLYFFDPIFVLFLYATTHEKKEMLENLRYVFYSKATFFDRYDNWTLTLTPTDLVKFKKVTIECLNNYKLKESHEDLEGFSIYFYLTVHPELFTSLKTLIDSNAIENLNQVCPYGNTSIMWAEFYECNEIKQYLESKDVLHVVNIYGEDTRDFKRNNKEK
jgi:hypothetical protein